MLWLIGNIARIAMIRDVADRGSEKGAKGVSYLFRESAKLLPRIVLMQLLVWSPYIVVQIIAYLLSVPPYNPLAAGAGPVPMLYHYIFVILGLAGVISLVLPLMDALSYRAIVIDGLGIVEGIKRAFIILRVHRGTIWSLVYYLYPIGGLVSLFIIFLIFPILFSEAQKIFAPVAACAMGVADTNALMTCAGQMRNEPTILVSFLVINVVTAFITAIPALFQSGAVTLAYLKFREDGIKG
jgi:hypothetical protein